uniref:Metallo-beta-lactamase domain-containing protein n=1 Tax=Panagrolaimus superbus TaxID=310955 RepID=A0A914YW48_9BILA
MMSSSASTSSTSYYNTSKEDEEFAKPLITKSFFGIKYSNPPSFTTWKGLPSFISLIRWFFFEKDESHLPSKEFVAKALPVITPKFDLKSKLSATWLGHATVFVQLEGLNIITDPVFSSRASPLFTMFFAGPKRYVKPPCPYEDLPPIHVGVISHNHYDHLDAAAVIKISALNPKIKWFVPLGVKKLMDSIVPDAEVIEKNWGEIEELQMNGILYKVLCTPAQHWSQRGFFDHNRSLWAGWAVMGPNYKFFYTGDTGFCEEEYKKLGKKYGPFQLAAIPIGCYCPRWIMQSQHINTEEAVLIHKHVKAENTIGIHWGTYLMGSNEPYLEPPKLFGEAAAKHGYTPKNLFTVRHGESWSYNP